MIELLVTIAIIAVLAAILLPVLGRAKYTANIVVCVSNQKQIATGWVVYAGDYDEVYPDYGNVNDPAYLAAIGGDSRNKRASPRYRPYSWANNDSRYPYLNGDLRPLVSPYLGDLDKIVHCPLEIPYFQKNHKFERKDADGNYKVSGYPGHNESSPKSTFWVWPGQNFYRFGQNNTSPRNAMRKVGESFMPAVSNGSNVNALRFDIILNDCLGLPGTYGGRSLYGPLSSHPSRAGGSVEHGSYADFYWWDWNTPRYLPVTASFAKSDGSVTTYWQMNLQLEKDTLVNKETKNWLWGPGPRGSFLPKDLAVD